MDHSSKTILLIATGGTIACKDTPQGLMPVLTAADLIRYVPETEQLCKVEFLQVCNIDSTDISPAVWCDIARAVKENYQKYDGFVITHGTDTMAYTSAALSYMIQRSEKPVVLTGSQKPINAQDSDARKNLRDSIRYACDGGSSDVVLVFDGNVIAGTRAKKMMARNYNAFQSINFPILARIQDEHIIRYIPSGAGTSSSGAGKGEDSGAPIFSTELSDSICVMKLIPGTRPEILSYLFENYDCIVIESFGVGGLPNALAAQFFSEMEKWSEKGKFVVMATQVVEEGSSMEIYQVGQHLKQQFDLMEAYDMTIEATLTKLMWLMARYPGDYAALRTGFYTSVNYDILCAFSEQ